MFKSVIIFIILSAVSLAGYCQDRKCLSAIITNLKTFDNDPNSKAEPIFTYIDFSDIIEDILCTNKACDIEDSVISKLKTLNPDDILYCTLLNHMRTALGENTLELLKNDKFMPTLMGGRETINRIIIPLTINRLNIVAQMKKTSPTGALEELVAERVIEYPAVDFSTEWHHPELYGLFSTVEKFALRASDGKTVWVRCYLRADELRAENRFNDKIEVSLDEFGRYLFIYKLNIPKYIPMGVMPHSDDDDVEAGSPVTQKQ